MSIRANDLGTGTVSDRLPEAATPVVASQRSVVKRRALGGILIRKECWTLSLRAKLVVVAACVGLVLASIRFAYPFLSVTNRMQGEVLVVEGWIPGYALEQAVTLFKGGEYRKIFTSGGITGDGVNAAPKRTDADYGATKLRRLGMTNDSVQPIPCWVERKDRTYNAALAVKQWFQENGVSVSSIDIMTLGPHARRSRLLFQKAFGKEVKVGVISVEDRDYDPAHWWRSSEGVREVLGEAIAYIYAKFFFSPS